MVLHKDIIKERISFEQESDLGPWRSSGQNVKKSSRVYKQGQHSMAWTLGREPVTISHKQWPGLMEACLDYPGGQPEVYEPAFIPKSRRGGIKLWVYRDRPNPEGELIFQMGQASSSDPKKLQNIKYRFAMKQNFSGWRALWVHFHEDANVDPNDEHPLPSHMEIRPNATMVGDTIHLDLFQALSFISRKRHSDFQFSNQKSRDRVDTYRIMPPWQKLAMFKEQNKTLTSQESDDLDLIEKRLEQLILGFDGLKAEGPFSKSIQKRVQDVIKSAKKSVERFSLSKKEGVVSGTPLFSSRDEQPAEQGEAFQVTFQNLLFPLALHSRLSPTPENLESYALLMEHVTQQGFHYGSSFGTTDHMIRLGPYSLSAFLSRNSLKKSHTEKQKTLDWYTHFGTLAQWDTHIGYNTDHIRGAAISKMIAYLLLPNSPEKAKRARQFTKYFSFLIEDAPGYSDTIKPDHSIFHHRGAYQNSYGIQSLTTLAMIGWLLRDTSFAYTEHTQEKLKRTLLAQFDFAADTELHPAVCGRFPYKNDALTRMLLPAYAYMALSDTEIIDLEMAETFAKLRSKSDTGSLEKYSIPALTYYGTFGAAQLLDHLSNAIKLDQPVQRLGKEGFFSFPYSGYATHKKTSYVATIRGFSKYIWDFESGHKLANPFGRYAAFGSLILFGSENDKGLLNLKSSQFPLEDIHWSYMPGATTKALPTEKTAYLVAAHHKYLEGKHRNFSHSTFLGSVDAGHYGVFGLDLHDSVPNDGDEPLFEDGFRAKKSNFFFEDFILCLGSDIESDDQQYNTITTLYQNVLDLPSPKYAHVNGSPTPQGQTQHGRGVFGDNQGHHYILPLQNKVICYQGEQQVMSIGKKKTKGYSKNTLKKSSSKVNKAYIDHGKAPKGARYHYAILPHSSPSQALDFQSKLPYEVLRQDARAHVVHLPQGNITAYVIYEANSTLEGPLVQTNTPILATTEIHGEELKLSVADPDLRIKKWNHNMSLMPEDIVHGKAKAHSSTIQLKGSWAIPSPSKDVHVKLQNGRTFVTLPLQHGLTRQLQFKKL
jgi:chondroitin-sulfate-ABC endolyase/exolyase